MKENHKLISVVSGINSLLTMLPLVSCHPLICEGGNCIVAEMFAWLGMNMVGENLISVPMPELSHMKIFNEISILLIIL